MPKRRSARNTAIIWAGSCATIYYPSLTAALAWLSARYTLVFLTTMFPNMPLLIHINEGGVVVGPECIALMLFYLCCSYAVNALSPEARR